MLRRTYRIVMLGVVVLLLLPSCGGAGSSGAIDRPSRTASPTRTPPTRSAPTRTPDSAATSAEAPRTSAAGPSSQPVAPSSSAESSSTSSSSGEDTSSGWWWLLIPVLVVAAIVVLLVQRRKRRAWRDRLAAAEREVAWFARDLVPQLRGAGSAAGVAGGWSVAAPRVTSLDDQLSRLATTAPGDEDRARVIAVQTAVRTSRDRVAAVVAAGDANVQWSLDLDTAQAPLLAVLVPPDDSPLDRGRPA